MGLPVHVAIIDQELSFGKLEPKPNTLVVVSRLMAIKDIKVSLGLVEHNLAFKGLVVSLDQVKHNFAFMEVDPNLIQVAHNWAYIGLGVKAVQEFVNTKEEVSKSNQKVLDSFTTYNQSYCVKIAHKINSLNLEVLREATTTMVMEVVNS